MPSEFDGIEKGTYVDADERTYRALTYDMLSSVDYKIDQIVNNCHVRNETCERRFAGIERRRMADKGIMALFGLVGGAIVQGLALLGIKIP